MAQVETDGIDLRVQFDRIPSPLARESGQRGEHRRADAAPAPLRQHRHAPERVRRGEAPGADRPPVGVAGEHVQAVRILRVEFQFQRYALFAHEHRLAHRAQGVAVGRIVGRIDAETARGGAHSPSSGNSSR